MVDLRFPPMLAAVGASVLLLAACDPAVSGGDETGSTTGDPGTTTSIDPSTTGDPPATSSTTTPTPETSSSSSTTASESSSSSSTGEPGDCVDEDIESAVGAEVVTGSNVGLSDDFGLRFCDGGVGSTTTAGSETGVATSVGTVGTSGVGDTGDTFGTTGGSAGDGGDFVVSWTPPSSGPFVIDTSGSDMDTVLTVVAPECGAMSSDCNDDCEGLRSGLIYEATEGETVYIVIEGYSGRRGSFVLNIAEGDALECDFGGSSTGGFDTEGSTTSAGTSPTG